MNDANSFLAEADFDKHDAFFTKDTPVGATLSGVIVEEPRVIETTDLNGDGKTPKLVLAIQHSDGVVYALWVKKGALATAVAKAAREVTGKPEVQKGGTLHVRFTGLGQASKPGYNPPKQWAAKYEAPAATAGVDQSSIFDD